MQVIFNACIMLKNFTKGFTVYVLYSPSSGRTYTGFTSNLEQRILSHNSLATKGYTLKFRPWVVIHTELFQSKQEAMAREKQLKTGAGRQFIKNIIQTKYP